MNLSARTGHLCKGRCGPSSSDLATVTPKRRLVEEHTLGIRSTVGSMLESTIGRERTNTIRRAERRARNALAKGLAVEEPQKSNRNPARNPAPNPQPHRITSPQLALGRRAGSRPTRSSTHPEPTMTPARVAGGAAREDAASHLSGDRHQNRQQPGALAHSFHRRGSRFSRSTSRFTATCS